MGLSGDLGVIKFFDTSSRIHNQGRLISSPLSGNMEFDRILLERTKRTDVGTKAGSFDGATHKTARFRTELPWEYSPQYQLTSPEHAGNPRKITKNSNGVSCRS
jgi:hypothetical protein